DVPGSCQHSGLHRAGDGGRASLRVVDRRRPADPAGSTVTLDVHLGGPALFGPIGMLVATSLKGDIRESLNRFKTVFVPT
ncbi:MAG: hypothetical protein ACXWZR_04380, partial [Mycobacterium sp.]